MQTEKEEKHTQEKLLELYRQGHERNLNHFLAVFFFFMSLFSCITFMQGYVLISWVEGFNALMIVMLYMLRNKLSLKRRQQLTLALVFFLVYAFLFVPTMANNTYLWMMAFPIFSLFLLGSKASLRWTLTLGLVSSITGFILWDLGVELYWPWSMAPYFVLDYSIVCVLSYTFFVQQEHYDGQLFQAVLDKETQNIELQLLAAEKDAMDQKYREVFENIQDCLYRTDIEGRLVFASPSVETLMCCKRDELIGTKLADYCIDPKGRELFFEQLNNSPDGKIEDFEIHVRRCDGEKVWLSATSHFVYSKEGEISGVEGILRDISKAKAAEDSLRILSQAFESAAESMIITDHGGNIEVVNKAFSRLTGYQAHEVVGKNAKILRSGKQNKALYHDLWSSIKAGKAWSHRMIDKKKDGRFFPVNLSIAPIYDKQKKLTHFVGVQSDLSEIMRLEEKYRQIQKKEAVETVVGGVAHDFNNILAAIAGSVYLAASKPESSDKYFEVIEGQIARASEIIKKLLAFVRKDTRVLAKISLSDCVAGSEKLFRLAVSDDTQFHVSICQDQLFVQGDYTQLQQVLLNLISNARDAVVGVDAPVISLSMKVASLNDGFEAEHPHMSLHGYAKLTVADNGHGIAEEYLSKIFDPFFTLKEVGKGTGLDLSMVKGTIESHLGFIDVDSVEGEGTRFHLFLPLTQVIQNAPSPVLENVQDLRQEEHKQCILLVDDEEEVRVVNRGILEALGYAVVEASDGLQAVERFLAYHREIKLVMMDVLMPHMEGIQAARKIRKIDQEVPIVFVTAYDQTQALSEAGKALQHCEFISKPFKVETLSALLKEGALQAKDHR